MLLIIPAVACLGDGGSVGVETPRDIPRLAGSLVSSDDLRYHWSSDGKHLVYRVNVGGGEYRFVRVDLSSGEKQPAFDQEELARVLAAATGAAVEPGDLPLNQIDYQAGQSRLFFRAFGRSWSLDLDRKVLVEDVRPPDTLDLLPSTAAHRGTRRTGESTFLTFENSTGADIEIFWIDGGGARRSYGMIAPGEIRMQQTYAGHFWLIANGAGESLAAVEAPEDPGFANISGRVAAEPERSGLSPDGKWIAFIRSHHLFIRPADGGEEIQLTRDVHPNFRYHGPLVWSPDSSRLAAFLVEDVEHRQIHIVETSPPDQLHPRLRSFDYRKPGDPIPQPMPRIFEIESGREIVPDNSLFENPWQLHDPAWSPDSKEFSFAYNQRGHRVMRIVAICGATGNARAIHEDRSETFIDYSQKFYLYRLPGTRELLWASEKDGYNHIYLIDDVAGRVKRQVTRGGWNVRGVVEVDAESRCLLLQTVGMESGNPYHVHYIRVELDNDGFTRLTGSPGHHSLAFSPCGEFGVAAWSRPDQPPVAELRRAGEGSLVAELERGDDSRLRALGWSRPERFTAMGRDGVTPIHGIIVKPSDFDPEKKYPVVENIYAGPHDHFVPQSFSAWNGLNEMAENGFIVVKIDGMGTNWRGKAFHDVAWKNLSDAGFPDRIEWIRTAAGTRPWMDLSRVGIYGGSAGGQSAVAALLHHGDFYHVAVAACGCHDNRMDKIWWNEAWMGWPVDESYEANSNVTHAAKLQGKLLLIVGELDTNVDPASTYQLVHALQRADKDFDFIPIIGAGHGAAETPYGKRRRADFLIRHLHGVDRPQ